MIKEWHHTLSNSLARPRDVVYIVCTLLGIFSLSLQLVRKEWSPVNLRQIIVKLYAIIAKKAPSFRQILQSTAMKERCQDESFHSYLRFLLCLGKHLAVDKLFSNCHVRWILVRGILQKVTKQILKKAVWNKVEQKLFEVDKVHELLKNRR